MALVYVTGNCAKWRNPSIKQGWGAGGECSWLKPSHPLTHVLTSGNLPTGTIQTMDTVFWTKRVRCGDIYRRRKSRKTERVVTQWDVQHSGNPAELAREEWSAKHRHIYCSIIHNREELEANMPGRHRTVNKSIAHPLHGLCSHEHSHLWWQHHNMDKCFIV